MRRFIPVAAILALAISAVPALADTVTPAPDAKPSAPAQGAPAKPGAPGIKLNCPSSSGQGNSERFDVRWWTDMYLIQLGPSRGNIQVYISFGDGSNTAKVALHNIQTGHTTPVQVFSTANPIHNFNVDCGNWMVQVTSTTGRAWGTISATPL